MAIEIHKTGKSIGQLRGKAKKLVRSDGIPLHTALDRVAMEFCLERSPGGPKWDWDRVGFWSDFLQDVWTLNDDGILISYVRGRGSETYHDLEIPPVLPKGIRLEIELSTLRDEKPSYLLENDKTPIYDLPDGLVWKVNFKKRLFRSVDKNGVLVQRLVINNIARCFDRNPEINGRCACCARHEYRKAERPDVGQAYKKAIIEGSRTRLAEWVVGTFQSFPFDVPSDDRSTWIYPSDAAEELVIQLDGVPERNEALRDAYDKENGIMKHWSEMEDEAWDYVRIGGFENAARLARQALKQEPKAIDCYVILSRAETTPSAKIKVLRKGTAIGDKLFKKELLAAPDDDFPFWGLLETRPYMRALQSLSLALVEQGSDNSMTEAVTIWRELYRICPNDNLGVRFLIEEYEALGTINLDNHR